MNKSGKIRSPEETQDAIDFITIKFQDNVARVNECIVRVGNVSQELKQLESNFLDKAVTKEEVGVKTYTISSDMELKYSKLDQNIFVLNAKIDAIKDAQDASRRSFNDKLAESEVKLENVKSNFKEIFSLAAKQSEVDFLKDFIEKKFQSVSKDFANLSMKQSEHAITLDTMQNRLDADKLDINNLYSEIAAISGVLSSLLSSFEKLRNDSQDHMGHMRIEFENSINEKLAKINKEPGVSPAALEYARSDILKKLEGVALDGSNAVLKSSNASQQITILEKKIENIYLLLKKLELSK